MKKFVCLFALIIISLFSVASVKAYCYNDYYTVSDVWDVGGTVYGYSATELSYCAGLYHDPVVSGVFLENATLLGTGYVEGYADFNPAIIYFAYNYPVAGQTYTEFADHYLIAYYQVYVPMYNGWYWYDPWQLGFMEIGGGYEAPSIYGFGYAYYWQSQYIYIGSTTDSMIYCGQTQCGTGQQFSPTGTSCSFQPTAGVCGSEPTNLTIHIKDKNGNNIKDTTQTAMLGVPVKLTAFIDDGQGTGNQGATFRWDLGTTNSEVDNPISNSIKASWTQEGTYDVSVLVSKPGLLQNIKVRISVQSPTFGQLSATRNPPRVDNFGNCSADNSSTPSLQFGCYSDTNPNIAGIKINGSANVPLGDISEAGEGKILFKQLGNVYRKKITKNVPLCLTSRNKPNRSSEWAYDGNFIGESYNTNEGEASFNNGSASAFITDSPAIFTHDSTEAYAEDSFETYLIYRGKTVNGNFVEKVLGKLPWNWQAKSQGVPGTHTILHQFSIPPSNSPNPIPPLTGSNDTTEKPFQGRLNQLDFEYCGDPTVLNSVVSGENVPSSVEKGTIFTVSITMTNTGQVAWIGDSGFKLIPRNNNWTAFAPILTETILPGQSKTFEFVVEAPPNTGELSFQWQMASVQNGVDVPFGQLYQKSILVTNPQQSCDPTGEEATTCYYWGGYWNQQTCTCEGYY
jgi:hypothetical protein